MNARFRLVLCALAMSRLAVSAETAAFQMPPISVPDGYTLELAAAPPLVTHPMMASFDDRGRLFVAETAGLNLKREELEEQLPGFITMLEDTDGDGRFDRSTRFVDKLTFPQGALWHEGALYVASSGGLWKFQDLDGDGVADRRQLLVGDFGYIGNAADIHGPFLHPGGRIYFVQGRHGHEVRDEAGNVISSSRAGGVFSIRPDGSDFRRHTTGGFDNPVELIFTDEGEVIGTVNIFEHQPRRDTLVHWVEGGLYPRTDFVRQWDEFVSTGDLLPAVLSFGHVAVSGLCRSRFDGGVYVTLFNTHEVRRVELVRQGATFHATQQPFLSSTYADFHPTDVLEDGDGSLLVIDTGGWFRIGCPTSQIAKPEVRGAIYRVRRTAAALPAPKPTALDALWASIRAGDEEAVWHGLHARDLSLRRIAAHGAGLLRAPRFVERLATMAVHDEHSVRRESATALGLIGDARAMPALLAALEKAEDRFLEHAIIYAMIQINAPATALAGLSEAHPTVRRGALIALDRMAAAVLEPSHILAAMQSADPSLRQAAMQVLVRRAAWAPHARQVLSDWLASASHPQQHLAPARDLLTAFIADPSVLDLAADLLMAKETATDVRAMLLDVLADHGPRRAPPRLVKALGAALQIQDPQLLWHAVRATLPMKNADWDARLEGLSADIQVQMRTRIAAMRSLAARGRTIDAHAFDLLLTQLAGQRPLLDRRDAAQVIALAPLDRDQLARLVQVISTAGPIELPLLVEAFKRGGDAAMGESLFAALAQAPGLPALEVKRLDQLARTLGPSASVAAQPLLAALRQQAGHQRTRLDHLERTLPGGGDPSRGKVIFFSRGTCFVCHRAGAEGGIIGPDLSTIGAIRGRRDLLEAIVFPSASFARGYEPMTAQLNDGSSFFGRIVRETQETLVLADPQGVEHPLPRDKIKHLRNSTTSLMPAGLEQLLNPQELADLLEYLVSLR